jgi:hypothetical protein
MSKFARGIITRLDFNSLFHKSDNGDKILRTIGIGLILNVVTNIYGLFKS